MKITVRHPFTALTLAACIAACSVEKRDVTVKTSDSADVSVRDDQQEAPVDAIAQPEGGTAAAQGAAQPKLIMTRPCKKEARQDYSGLANRPAAPASNAYAPSAAKQSFSGAAPLAAPASAGSPAPASAAVGAAARDINAQGILKRRYLEKDKAENSAAAAPSEYREEAKRAESDEMQDGEYPRCYPNPEPVPRPATPNTAEYAPIYENPFLSARQDPLSTFSIDVDGASYSNTRRFLQEGQLPPSDAVRIEEFINYFDYDYPQPSGSDPFSITTEVATTPWNPQTKLVHIGLQGKRMEADRIPPNNLVFLIDVSGSMDSPERLPLLKDGFEMLIDQLRPQDKVSIVVYAGAAGMVLPPTSGRDKQAMRDALEHLQAGGSTAGGAGLMLAYQAARQSFIRGGINRVILATDGDFNVGISDDGDLVKLIERERQSGVFLSALGFGTDNYKDAKMEQLADKGNGNYFYIDNEAEARKVLVEKMTGTLYTIAKDVKLQVEFNPSAVQAYRLIGYENRALAAEDFNDDRKDAGELGAGSNVTALYEIVPTHAGRPKVDPLKYQDDGRGDPSEHSDHSGWHWNFGLGHESGQELLTVKFRYKQPNGNTSKLISRVLRDRDQAWQDASENFRFSAAAAGFGLMLRGSQYRGNLEYDKVLALARGSRGKDLEGHRSEFLSLVSTARSLSGYGRVGSARLYR